MQMEQGDIIFVEKIKEPLLVVSKNFFNTTEAVMVCPIVQNADSGPLHIPIMSETVKGVVLCEQMRFLDLRVRELKKMDRILFDAIINITDAVQSIFDYY